MDHKSADDVVAGLPRGNGSSLCCVRRLVTNLIHRFIAARCQRLRCTPQTRHTSSRRTAEPPLRAYVCASDPPMTCATPSLAGGCRPLPLYSEPRRRASDSAPTLTHTSLGYWSCSSVHGRWITKAPPPSFATRGAVDHQSAEGWITDRAALTAGSARPFRPMEDRVQSLR